MDPVSLTTNLMSTICELTGPREPHLCWTCVFGDPLCQLSLHNHFNAYCSSWFCGWLSPAQLYSGGYRKSWDILGGSTHVSGPLLGDWNGLSSSTWPLSLCMVSPASSERGRLEAPGVSNRKAPRPLETLALSHPASLPTRSTGQPRFRVCKRGCIS